MHLRGGIWEEASGRLGGGIGKEATGGRHLPGLWEGAAVSEVGGAEAVLPRGPGQLLHPCQFGLRELRFDTWW